MHADPIGGLKGHRKVTNQVPRPQMTTELPCGSWLHPQRRQRGLGFGPAPFIQGAWHRPCIHTCPPAAPATRSPWPFLHLHPSLRTSPYSAIWPRPATKPMPPRERAPARRTDPLCDKSCNILTIIFHDILYSKDKSHSKQRTTYPLVMPANPKTPAFSSTWQKGHESPVWRENLV